MAALPAGEAVTTAAGLVITWLRGRSGSLLAPVLAHWATNALGLLTAATSRPPHVSWTRDALTRHPHPRRSQWPDEHRCRSPCPLRP
jgi:hypothetical protein